LSCNKQFHQRSQIDIKELYENYIQGKQTYRQLSTKYGVSEKTIQRKLDKYQFSHQAKETRIVTIVMDTTYWGRNFGVMLFRDSIKRENLHKYYVKTETIKQYILGIQEIEKLGFTIKAIVCDGRLGIFKAFKDKIPIQMCHFHQKQIIRRYLTTKPKLEASILLWKIVESLGASNEADFIKSLENWMEEWKDFYNERTLNPITNKSHYTHKRLRSAYNSLKRHLPYLFTCKKLEDVPNTTNTVDGTFSDLKSKLRNHNGLNKERKIKFINAYLKT
jgi:hypothetical protein